MFVQDPHADQPAPPSEFPGWYPDPFSEALDRFWNGRFWTDKVKDEPTPPVDPELAVPTGASRLERRLSEALAEPPVAVEIAEEAVGAPTPAAEAAMTEDERQASVFAVGTDAADEVAPPPIVAPVVAEPAPPPEAPSLPRRPPSLFRAADRSAADRTAVAATPATAAPPRLDLGSGGRAEVTADLATDAETAAESVIDADEVVSEAVDAGAVLDLDRLERPAERVAAASTSTLPTEAPTGPPTIEVPGPAPVTAPATPTIRLGSLTPEPADVPVVPPTLPIASGDGTPSGAAPEADGPDGAAPNRVTADPVMADPVGSHASPDGRRAPLWLGIAVAAVGLFVGGVAVGRLVDVAGDGSDMAVAAPEVAVAGTSAESTDSTGGADDAGGTDDTSGDAVAEEQREALAAVEADRDALEAELERVNALAEQSTAAEAELEEALTELRAELDNSRSHNEILLTWFTSDVRGRSEAAWDGEVARACAALSGQGRTEATTDDVVYGNWQELMGTEADLVAAVDECLAG